VGGGLKGGGGGEGGRGGEGGGKGERVASEMKQHRESECVREIKKSQVAQRI